MSLKFKVYTLSVKVTLLCIIAELSQVCALSRNERFEKLQ